MSRKNLFLIICLLLISHIFTVAQTPPGSAPAIKVKYGIYIKQLLPDFKASRFHAEFYWWAIFQNDTTNKNNPSNDEIVSFSYVNGIDCSNSGFRDEIEEIQHWDDNYHYYTGFHQGDFYFNPDYSMYPLDVQKMEIQLEHVLFPKEKLVFSPDTGSYIASGQNRNLFGLSKNILNQKNSVYNIFKSEISLNQGEYNSNFGDPAFNPISVYSRMSTGVHINRSFSPYIAKLIIPLMIILALVYLVFFLPAEKIDIAAGLTVTSLLSAIAFQLSISGEIPEIGYIIYIDKIFYTCYFLIAVSMVQSIITFYLDKSGDERKMKMAIKLDFIFRFIFPLLFMISLFIFAN